MNFRAGCAVLAAAVAALCVSPLTPIAAALTASGSRAATPQQAAPQALKLEACRVPGVPGAARCGTYEVYEDRVSRRGRMIELKVVVLPATGREREPDALTFIAGGPGGSAIASAGGLARGFARVRERRDILLVDQRGTGESHPLNCDLFGPPSDLQSYLGAFLPLEAVRECSARLADEADLRLYTTDLAMDDLDEVRSALGYPQLNLFGVSYGTRAALVYLRRHGAHARTAILQGVAPTGYPAPRDFPQAAQRALDRVLEECAADAECGRAFPDIRQDAEAVFRRLEAAPASVTVLHPETAEPIEVRLSRDVAGEAVRYLLYGSATALQVPAVLDAAAAGDYAPLAEFALFARREIVSSGSNGLYLSITCAEDVPWIEPGAGERSAEGTFLGDYRLREQRAACAEWPRGSIPADYREPVRSDVPTLILSGEWDPVTPPNLGEETARHLSRSEHVVVPFGGHGFDGLEGLDCIDGLIQATIERGTVEGLDTSCARDIRRPPFPTDRPPMQPIPLEADELRRLAGRYAAAGGGFELVLESDAQKLTATLPDGRRMLLVPVAPARFRVIGLPGAFVVFDLNGERVEGLRLEEGGTVTLELVRRDG